MISDPTDDTQSTVLPQAFVSQVKDALEHLYDLNYLQNHPLARREGSGRSDSTELAGQRLRRDLVGAMEALAPGVSAPMNTPDARSYDILLLRYMETMTVQETAHEAGVSLRQAHRDLRSGEANVATILWHQHFRDSGREDSEDIPTSLREEMARLGASTQPTDLYELVTRAVQAVEPLAKQRGIGFRMNHTVAQVFVPTEPVIAEQAIVNMLSHAIGQAVPGQMSIDLIDERHTVSVLLTYGPRPGSGISDAPADSLLAEFTRRLGWSVNLQDRSDGNCTVALRTGKRCPSVLVVDDNDGFVQLVERYLTGQACQILGTTASQESLQLASRYCPDVIILDIMMPGLNGWEVLQRLRHHPRTAETPVIVCSVINNPELAHALGASSFLSKPIGKVRLLQALGKLGVL
ncbi:MAG: response regulator [Anaerolineae bacterium]|nr:response regulator [Anaerolineae bacterium]